MALGQQGAYTIIVSNAITAAATSGTVTVSDALPNGLTPVSMIGTGWSCVSTTCTRSDPLAPGASYPPITVTVNVVANAVLPLLNTATVSGGGSASASISESALITGAPVLSITSAHSGSFAVGQQGTYTLTVANAAGAGPTNGTVTATNTPPSGLTLASMSGTGWSCSGNTCSRSDVLTGGASYPSIALTVNVAAHATSPQINAAKVSGGGWAGASTSDLTVLAGVPVLSITKTHTGSFALGQQGAVYTLTVSNGSGTGPTNGTVSVSDTLPSGLTLASMGGTGWSCAGSTCSRSDVLAAGSSYSAITVAVNVAPHATTPQVNYASVSGGGAGTAAVSDPTTITGAPVLALAKMHTGNFGLGQRAATYALSVSNIGTGPTSGAVAVSDTLPSGLTLASMAGTGWSCAGNSCSRSDALGAGSSYPPITATINVAVNATSPLVNEATVSGGASTSASASDSTTIVFPSLSIAKTHTGNFTQGQQAATYTITASNAAATAPTNGTVTVTDTLPSGLALVSMAGTGWSCATSTCTRSDALAPGSSYPPITVTVSVSSTAPSQVQNVANVSGGASSGASASDTTSISPPIYAISGSVTVGGSGLSGVAVSLSGTYSASTVTDASGDYTFSGLTAAGTYTVWPSRVGYSFTAPVTFADLSSSGTANFTGMAVAGLEFYPVTPCRLVDTRVSSFQSGFGPPSMAAGQTRTFAIPSNAGCGIPSTAAAYSLNVTVVTKGYLGVLSIWPAGQPMPNVSTLNSYSTTSTAVANAAIVPAGANSAISVYVTDPTDLIIDINGYFTSASNGLELHPVTPCRLVDTRVSSFQSGFGPPSMGAGATRSFAIPSNAACGIPSSAAAYSLNITAVPQKTLGALSVWPAGQALPNISTLNVYTAGTVVANAAIVPAGNNGAISAYVTDATDLVIDINGYFAPGSNGLKLYPVTPCRVADTRVASFPTSLGPPTMSAGTQRPFQVPASMCEVPSGAGAYSFNFTAVPHAPQLGIFITWPTGQSQPGVSTMNSYNGSVVANAAIVPAGSNGAISIYVTDSADVLFDINGYFAQ